MGVDCDGPIAVLMQRGRARRRGDPLRAAPALVELVGTAGRCGLGRGVRLACRRRWRGGSRPSPPSSSAGPGPGESGGGAAAGALLVARDEIELLAWELAYGIAPDDRDRRIRLGRLRVALATLDEEILAHPRAFLVAAPLLVRERADFRLSAPDRDRFWWWYEIPAWAADAACASSRLPKPRWRNAWCPRRRRSGGEAGGPKGGPVDGPKGGARPGA